MQLPPAPVGTPFGSYTWADWYQKIRFIINDGQINHNDLQNLQGGTSTERYHLTAAQVALIGPTMTIKKITRSVITITAGNTSNTFTISPALADLQKAELRFNGCSSSTGSVNDTMTYVFLTNTTTITAVRAGTGGTSSVSFELIEYN